jgi:hypothetical protein
MKINKKMSIKHFALTVAGALKQKNIDVVLTGGAVVSIYSNNKYQSSDVDFLSDTDHQIIKDAMHSLGFKNQGKDFFHSDIQFTVEFPGYDLIIGDEPMQAEGEIKENGIVLKLLSPTQCVMDRLAAFYHWKDRQSLDQAVLVASDHPIKLKKVEDWSRNEGMIDRFRIFVDALKAVKK